jgi:hypothetical protein
MFLDHIGLRVLLEEDLEMFLALVVTLWGGGRQGQ